MSVTATVTHNDFNGNPITVSPFISATEAAELDTTDIFGYEDLATTGRMTVSTSTTTLGRSQVYTRYISENLEKPYLNTMSANAFVRERY